MKIAGIAAKFPEKNLSIEETIDLIKHHSRNSFQGDLPTVLRKIKALLKLSGARNRKWLTNEKPIDLLAEAVEDVLIQANVNKQDVDLLMYVGIGKGFIEPAGAYLAAKSLGLDHAECFDITDACMSWTRALYTANHYLKDNCYQNILVVNAEFNNIEGSHLFPDNYQLTSMEQLNWIFPTYTVGNACTATLLTNEVHHDWEWHFKSKPQLADLCTVATDNYRHYTKHSPRLGLTKPNLFCSFGRELHEEATIQLPIILKQLSTDKQNIAQIFPHASSLSDWQKFANTCGVLDKMYFVYPEYGNLVSASVPAGIALAIDEQKTKRGDTLAGWVGSAGMSFSAFSFTY